MQSRFDQELEDRLVRYAAIDSQSDETSPTTPSTQIQFDMLNLLRDELIQIGAQDVEMTGDSVVVATIPGTASGPTVGFLAHVDTAPQFNATGVKPRVIKGYNGGDITFPDNPDLVLSPDDHPYLAEKIGHDLITGRFMRGRQPLMDSPTGQERAAAIACDRNQPRLQRSP